MRNVPPAACVGSINNPPSPGHRVPIKGRAPSPLIYKMVQFARVWHATHCSSMAQVESVLAFCFRLEALKRWTMC